MSAKNLLDAIQIASAACREAQRMPCENVDPRLIAEACEMIGEQHAARCAWRKVAIAHRMACWYYRKALEA